MRAETEAGWDRAGPAVHWRPSLGGGIPPSQMTGAPEMTRGGSHAATVELPHSVRTPACDGGTVTPFYSRGTTASEE